MGQTYYYSNNYLENGSFEILYINHGTEQEPDLEVFEDYVFPNWENQVSYSIGKLIFSGTDPIDANGWISPNPWWSLTYSPTQPTFNGYGGGTSDYFHKYGTSKGKWENISSYLGCYRKPYHGDGYTGIVLLDNIKEQYSQSTFDVWKEYIHSKIPLLMPPGEYHVSFRISKAPATSNNDFTNHSIGNFGAYFSRERLIQDYLYPSYPKGSKGLFNSGTHPDANNPIVLKTQNITSEPNVNGEGGWDIVEGTIEIPDISGQSLQYYITIGHFDDEPIRIYNKVLPPASPDDFVMMYYFIDSVQVRRISECNYNIQILEDPCYYDANSNKIGTEYTVVITKEGVCEDFDDIGQIRISQKGGEVGYINWTEVGMEDVASNPNVTVFVYGSTTTYTYKKFVVYDDDDLNQIIGFRVELITNHNYRTLPIDHGFLEKVYEPCCDCNTIDLTDVNTEDWISLGNEVPLTPADTACLIDLSLMIPSPYDACFTHLKLYAHNQIDGEIINSEMTSVDMFETLTEAYTLKFGDETIVTLTLYRQENDSTPCIINKIYKCPCDCPEEMEDWFTMTIGPMPDSCETDCYVQHNLNIPEYYSCFKYYFYSNPHQGIEAGVEPLSLDDVEDQISQFDGCLGYGESSGAIITLLRYPGDTEPCILEYSVHCDSNIVIPDWIPLPCDTTCAIPYDTDTLTIELDNCPECYILSYYRTRVNCDDEQEIELSALIYGQTCYYCPYTEDVIFKEVIEKIIKNNKMTFKPLNIEECDTTWRIGIGTCWAWVRYYYYKVKWEIEIDPSTGLTRLKISLIPRSFLIHKKCNETECCTLPVEVCRDLNNEIIITPRSLPESWDICNPMFIFDFWMRSSICEPKCHWFNVFNPHTIIEPKGDNNLNNHNYDISSTKEENIKQNTEATIIIYDLIGRQVLSRQIAINNDETESILRISDLISGIYRYIIMIDGKVVKSDKIIITK
jgi:hypothetical protein